MVHQRLVFFIGLYIGVHGTFSLSLKRIGCYSNDYLKEIEFNDTSTTSIGDCFTRCSDSENSYALYNLRSLWCFCGKEGLAVNKTPDAVCSQPGQVTLVLYHLHKPDINIGKANFTEALISGSIRIGCYKYDDIQGILTNRTYTNVTTTTESECLSTCSARKSKFLAIDSKFSCLCGDKPASMNETVDTERCDECSNNVITQCGHKYLYEINYQQDKGTTDGVKEKNGVNVTLSPNSPSDSNNQGKYNSSKVDVITTNTQKVDNSNNTESIGNKVTEVQSKNYNATNNSTEAKASGTSTVRNTASTEKNEAKPDPENGSKNYFVVIMIVITIAILTAAGIFLYKYRSSLPEGCPMRSMS